MLSKSLIPALSLASLFLSTSSALPSRTHCRCTIRDADLSPQPELTSTLSDSRADICSTLGAKLENLRNAKPELYADFIAHSLSTEASSEDATSTADEISLATTIVLQMAAQNGFQNLRVVLPSAPAEQSRERVVCRAEDSHQRTPLSYQVGDQVTFLALQVIVAISILACVAEGVTLAVRWFFLRPSPTLQQSKLPEKPVLRLSGNEKPLKAFPAAEDLFSPGVEKKMRAYGRAEWTPSNAPSPSRQKKTFEAYVSDDDDEQNWPVM